MAYDANHPLYPSEWCIAADAKPCCKAFRLLARLAPKAIEADMPLTKEQAEWAERMTKKGAEK